MLSDMVVSPATWISESQGTAVLFFSLASLLSAFSYFVARLRDHSIGSVKYRLLGRRNDPHIRNTIENQWKKNKEEKYILQMPKREVYVLPNHYVDDYSWKPDSEISSNIDLRERVMGRWTYLGSLTPESPGDRTHEAVQYVKLDLTKNIKVYTVPMHEEIRKSVDQLGMCDDWMSRSAYWFSLNITLPVFQRIFFGGELGRNDEWNRRCLSYGSSALKAAARIISFPAFIRPVVAPFLAENRALQQGVNEMQRIIAPYHKVGLHER